MRVIVVGAGEVGYHVADKLSNERHDVVVVDIVADRLDYVQSHLDVAVLEGSGASPSVLEKAGIGEAGLLLAVTSDDHVNLVSCMMAGPRKRLTKVARVSNPEFYDEGGHLYSEEFGVDLMINPEKELAEETFRLLQSAVATDITDFAGGAVQLVGLYVADHAPIAERMLREVAEQEGQPALLTIAIERDGKTIVPNGTTVIRAGDHIYVVAAAGDLSRAIELCGHRHQPVRRVMLAGGSVETYYLARLLQRHGVQAVALVENRDRAQELAEKLEKTLVLNANATDIELLELEGVGGMDAFVAFTDYDETNILSSVVAKHAGAKKVITLVNKSDYVPLARRVGIDAAVSPRQSAANAILRYVRRGSVTRVATFKDVEGEVLSFTVSSASPLVGKPLSAASLPRNTVVAAIVRGRAVVIPRGSDRLEAGDTAVVFAVPDAVAEVTKLFPS